MPRKIDYKMPIEELEFEVLYTQATLKADPDAAELHPLTEEWLKQIDQIRLQGWNVRLQEAEADAARTVANNRLDEECQNFADHLWLEVGKDSKDPRWTKYFKMAVSRFLRTAFPAQVATVRGWLDGPSDPVLERHRDGLERWTQAGVEALIKTQTVAAYRGQYWQQREDLADGLTRERDALQDALAEKAREKKLHRNWPELFFRQESASERANRPKLESLEAALT